MTVCIPNYLTESKNKYRLINDNNFTCSKSYIYRKDKLSLRTTTHVVILLINGSKLLHLENKDIQVTTNEILYLSQGNYFMSEVIRDTNAYESILICFDDEFVLDFLNKYNILIDDRLSNKKFVKIDRNDFIESCIKNINEYFSSHLDNKVDLVKLKTHELFLYSLSKDKEKFTSFLKNILETKSSRVKFILESNLDIINNISDMCKLTKLNNTALRKEIFKLYGLKPKEWLDTNRLKKAFLLLKNSNYSISQISTSCGYSSVSWFINQFKNKYNTTPNNYRKNL